MSTTAGPDTAMPVIMGAGGPSGGGGATEYALERANPIANAAIPTTRNSLLMEILNFIYFFLHSSYVHTTHCPKESPRSPIAGSEQRLVAQMASSRGRAMQFFHKDPVSPRQAGKLPRFRWNHTGFSRADFLSIERAPQRQPLIQYSIFSHL